MSAAPIKNRVTEITGTDYPIIQAPMSWIARAQLASAVCNAGGLGIIETGSGELDAAHEENLRQHRRENRAIGNNHQPFRSGHDRGATPEFHAHAQGEHDRCRHREKGQHQRRRHVDAAAQPDGVGGIAHAGHEHQQITAVEFEIHQDFGGPAGDAGVDTEASA